MDGPVYPRVGYQAQRTTGAALVRGANQVKFLGAEIDVRAKIHTLGGFSAHAGQSELLDWLGAMADSQPRLVITHGEDGPRKALAAASRERFGLEPELPGLNETLEL